MNLSVLIPGRNAAEALSRQAPEVLNLLESLPGVHEVLIVDDGSRASEAAELRNLAAGLEGVRLIRLSRAVGLSAALSVGIEAAQGEIIVAMEPGRRYLPTQIRWLLGCLSRADFVIGRRQRNRPGKWWRLLCGFPRRLLLGQDARDPECLFWAARHEAVQGLSLSRGLHAFLPSLVSQRGFRVSETFVGYRPGPRPEGHATGGRLGNLLSLWWLGLYQSPYSVHEVDLRQNVASQTEEPTVTSPATADQTRHAA